MLRFNVDLFLLVIELIAVVNYCPITLLELAIFG